MKLLKWVHQKEINLEKNKEEKNQYGKKKKNLVLGINGSLVRIGCNEGGGRGGGGEGG